MRAVAALCVLAAGFWFLLFSSWTAGAVNFWAGMTLATGVLAGAALVLDRRRLLPVYALRPWHVALGLGSAIALYMFFWAGDAVARAVLPFAGREIGGVYATRTQAPTALIAVLLAVWIGPAEEVFWRGFVQRRLGEWLGSARGWLVAALLYTVVHVWSANLMLLVAAAVCGLFWGALFWRCRSVWPGLISHAVWDVVIFVLLPLR